MCFGGPRAVSLAQPLNSRKEKNFDCSVFRYGTQTLWFEIFLSSHCGSWKTPGLVLLTFLMHGGFEVFSMARKKKNVDCSVFVMASKQFWFEIVLSSHCGSRKTPGLVLLTFLIHGGFEVFSMARKKKMLTAPFFVMAPKHFGSKFFCQAIVDRGRRPGWSYLLF